MNHSKRMADAKYTVTDKIQKSWLFYDLVKRLYDIKEAEIPTEESDDEYEDDADEEKEEFPEESPERETGKATKRKLKMKPKIISAKKGKK